MENSDEDDTEEIIVYANFEEGTVEKEIFQIPNVKLKIIGLDSDTPIVQLSDYTFKGEWNDTIGTKLLLEEDLSPEQVDPTFTVTPETMLKYKCRSTKTLDLSKIFLKPNANKKAVESNETLHDDNIIETNIAGNEVLENVFNSIGKTDEKTDNMMAEIVNDALNE